MNLGVPERAYGWYPSYNETLLTSGLQHNNSKSLDSIQDTVLSDNLSDRLKVIEVVLAESFLIFHGRRPGAQRKALFRVPELPVHAMQASHELELLRLH